MPVEPTTKLNDRNGYLDNSRGSQMTTGHQHVYNRSHLSQAHMRRANPAPLGMLGFAITTLILGLYKCGAGVPNSNLESSHHAVFGLAIFMGGFAQFVAGVLEFTVGNTFYYALHCSYGAFWLSYAMFLIPSLDLKAAFDGDMYAYTFAKGIFLLPWCLLTIIFLMASLRVNVVVIGSLLFVALSLLFLAIGEFITTTQLTQSEKLNKVGGAFAVVGAMFAFYGGASGLMSPNATPIRLPLGVIRHRSLSDKTA